MDTRKPSGILAQSNLQNDLNPLLDTLKDLQQEFSFDINLSNFEREEISSLNKLHFGRALQETHCFRGYPTFGSIKQFHESDDDYILHLDCDMIFYESSNFSWIQQAVQIMQENEDIACVLPRGGPPTFNGRLQQGTTKYEFDRKRNLYLFKNFTSRHYLVHRERFLNLLPMKPIWLSWREPFKSLIWGNGKMLCWEAIVGKALENSNYWRADLASSDAWSIHPGDRSEQFYELLPVIFEKISLNQFPDEQRGNFDLVLESWKNF